MGRLRADLGRRAQGAEDSWLGVHGEARLVSGSGSLVLSDDIRQVWNSIIRGLGTKQ